MRGDLHAVLAEVIRLAPTLHKAGTFSRVALEALVRHASQAPVQRSVETGSGASTILFSHISDSHTVFAMDSGTGSIRRVENSPLLRGEVVTFVEGPTQLTLPQHRFAEALQLALIDGPHAYPFPELEYYYLYPHLEAGALLVVDDIHIPTIGNLFEFLSAEEMFHLEEVVETTAFFRRTTALTFSPVGDGWETQRYNRQAFEPTPARRLTGVPPAPVTTPTPFYVDQLGSIANPTAVGRLVLARSETLTVSGWALDAANRRPAYAVDLMLDGEVYRAPVKVPRPDVASLHGDHRYLRSGFSAAVPSAGLAPGPHVLEVRIVLADGLHYYGAARLPFRVS